LLRGAFGPTIQRSGIDTILIGANRIEQLSQHVASLEVELIDDQRARMDQVSAPPSFNPYFIFSFGLNPTTVMEPIA